jgi:transposase InsO family protein
MSDKRSEELALFKYRIIAEVLNNTGKWQMKHFKKMANQEHDVPYCGKKKYKAATFKAWLRAYRIGGFDALKPKTRSDKGGSRKIDEKLGKIIKEKVKSYQFLSSAGIYRLLISEGDISSNQIGEGAFRKYIKDNKLKVLAVEPKARKKFEKQNINELWIADCMHGPYIINKGKKQRVFLISVIDDCSRVIVGSKFFFHENSISLELVLKEGISKFGLPQNLYTDNGAIFVSSHLQLACARLGIALIHSKPYDSPSRGKIERFFRTVREKFLPLTRLSEIASIEDLNRDFLRWLDKEYQKQFHHGIGTKPMDKWIDKQKDTAIKRVSSAELNIAFYITLKRKVKNDATISVNNILYEVPARFMGKIIEIRYPADKKEELRIYENDKPICLLNKVNLQENASPPSWEIKFNQGEI